MTLTYTHIYIVDKNMSYHLKQMKIIKIYFVDLY